MPLSQTLLPLLLTVLPAAPLASQGDSSVRVAISPDGESEAWIEAGEGLWLNRRSSPETTLPLSHGSFPRFTQDGRVFFEETRDDGHRILNQRTMVLDPGKTLARPATRDERIPAYRLPPLSPTPSNAIKLCIDAGHGGSDPGAIGFGLQEKDITLDIALRLRHLLAMDTADRSGGGTWNVLLTRSDDSFVGLSQRANLANAFGATSFLSIHVNSFTSSSANGTETYCYLGQSANTGGFLRNAIHEEAIRSWGLRNRGVKEANFAVLRLTSMPAALAETGFITSPIDIQKLQDPAARSDMALAYLFALQEHHGFAMFDPRSTGGVLGWAR